MAPRQNIQLVLQVSPLPDLEVPGGGEGWPQQVQGWGRRGGMMEGKAGQGREGGVMGGRVELARWRGGQQGRAGAQGLVRQGSCCRWPQGRVGMVAMALLAAVVHVGKVIDGGRLKLSSNSFV